MNKKLLIIPALVLLTVLSYTTIAKADEVRAPWHQEMVSQIAAKLGVSDTEVDSAMSEVHEQMRVERQVGMQSRFEERLQTLVSEGKLTEGQREAWIAKHEDMTAEREAERLAHHEEMQAWFEAQGIDPTLLTGLGMGGRGRGMHAGW